MMKVTQKELRQLVASGSAEDVTRVNTIEGYEELKKKEGYFTQIGYSCGMYGCSGKLLQGNKTGKLYAVTSRTNAIYLF